MLKRTSGYVAAALAIAVAATSLDIAPAQAAPKSQPQATQSTDTTTDFSARRRWRGGNRAGLAIVAGMFGTIAALAAADQYNNGYYYGDPGYGYGGYGGYRGGYRGGWHHRHHH
jgi:hypothetical protein